jgi:hypothetical protein
LAKNASPIAANKTRDVCMSVAHATLRALNSLRASISLRALDSADAVVDEFYADNKKHRVHDMKKGSVADSPVHPNTEANTDRRERR